MVDKLDNSNQVVVNEEFVDAPVDDVWEAVATEEGRERWLSEEDGERELVVESEQAPGEQGFDSGRIVWWWWNPGEEPRRVELLVVAAPRGTRVIAVESAPGLPLTLLASIFAPAYA
jgi:uncharacterized protein YndB with AHSA1/START domain